MKVQKDKVGLIIGKGGETIRQIQDDCKVKLNVESYADENGERIVSIAGAKEAIAMAMDMILEKLDGRRGISESQLGAQFDSSYAQQDVAYAAAYGNGVPAQYTLQYDMTQVAAYYKQYYEGLGYTFPADFDYVAYILEQSGVQE